LFLFVFLIIKKFNYNNFYNNIIIFIIIFIITSFSLPLKYNKIILIN